MKLSYLHHN